MTEVQNVQVCGDGYGIGGEVDGLQQDLHCQGQRGGAGAVSEGGHGAGYRQREGGRGGEVAPYNPLAILMGNAKEVDWSQLVNRRSMKDVVKPARPGSNQKKASM